MANRCACIGAGAIAIGESLLCHLPDDTICALPTWMFEPACHEHSVGPPLIAVDAIGAFDARPFGFIDALLGRS